ncbi:hypothetical protein AB8E26_14750 [Stenotrophomonas rhizophila]|uniref:hypothetical protein n=1 Tax=Stenotrophomonas rhizophila TaxID=216778 RepID=UPI0035137996
MITDQPCARLENQLARITHAIDSLQGSPGCLSRLIGALAVVVDDLDETPVSDLVCTVEHLEHRVEVTPIRRSLNRSGANCEADLACAAAGNPFDSLSGYVDPNIASLVNSRECACGMPKLNCISVWILSGHHVDAPAGRRAVQMNGSDDTLHFYQECVPVQLLRIIHQLNSLACVIRAYHCRRTAASRVARGAILATLVTAKPPRDLRTKVPAVAEIRELP